MEITNDKRLLIGLLSKNLIKLVLAGAIIGIFHRHDHLVAAFLMIYLVYSLFRKFKQNESDQWIFLVGLILTGLLGVVCEYWGISNQYWSYHNLDDNREFPYWLPIAWALAFTFVYRLEKEIIILLHIRFTFTKIVLALAISMVFPTVGEIVVINLGAWTYHWPFQFLGVPLLAIGLLMVFHTGINFLLMFLCKQLKIQNVVFSSGK